MEKNMWYIIFSGENEFKVLELLNRTHTQVWELANDYWGSKLEEGVHYDILGGFRAKSEALQAIADHSDDKNVLLENLNRIGRF